MSQVNLYSSAPLGTKLALACLGLERLGLRVALRPLAELPSGPHPRLASLRHELTQVCQRLATIGEALTAHEDGALRLAAGDEQGLRAERDALLSRKRGIEGSLVGQEGGQGNG